MTGDVDGTALIAIRPSLCGHAVQLAEKQLERLADRLGYVVLATVDTDVIHDLWMLLTRWSPDVVIVGNEAHIELADVMRLCDVITLNPEAVYSGDRYELLRLEVDDRRVANPLLPQRIPGASGLAPHPNRPKPVAVTTADWTELLRALTAVRRARDTAAHRHGQQED